ncbi:MAG: ATP-dependent DNA ligase [Candidatus Altarchaeaceae archaeon]
MYYLELVEVLEKLEKITGRIEMTDIVAEFLKKVPDEDINYVILTLQGLVFPIYDERKLSIAENLAIVALSNASGWSEEKIKEKIKEEGDLGNAAEKILQRKIQKGLFSFGEEEKITIGEIYKTYEKISEYTGQGSQERKISMLSKILTKCKPKEAKYVIRTVLGELRVGVGEGIIRDAIAKIYAKDENDVENLKQKIENVYNLTSDFGEILKFLRENKDIENISMKIGRPIRVMLAEKLPDIETGIEKLQKAGIEVKYDGVRAQIHKDNDKIFIYTRRLENITNQFPEIVEFSRKNINAKSCIIEGEIVAIYENRKPMPFQNLSKRIKRKYEIEEMVKEIPVEINLFDIIYLNGKSLINESFENRRKILESIINQTERFRLAEQIVTDNIEEAKKFYNYALEMGHEGVMMKNLKAPYKPGLRVGYMYKIKPVMETLDLVIVGAEWGEGRRANWLATFLLACRDEATNELKTIGMMGTGLTDEQFEEITKILKPLIIEEKGKEVKVKPQVVVEVAYEEIQRSPTYTSGYALRFPRLVRIREDKGVNDIDTIERIENLMQQ